MNVARGPALDTSDIVQRCDFWRRSPASAGGAAGHKEWSYFCVLADDVQLVAAFSLMDRPADSPLVPARVEEARVTVLARHSNGAWSGDIECHEPAAVAVRAGRIDARFGDSALAFVDGRFRVRIRSAAAAITATLDLVPIARPALTRSVPLGPEEPMFWFVAPLLDCTGELHAGGRVHRLRRAPAYHDHNWGRFSWGGDFAWEWGVVLAAGTPSCSVIYYRITDRRRHVVVSQGLLVWRSGRHVRTFRDDELSVRSHGILRSGGCLRLPRVMRLVVQDAAADLPSRLEIAARGGDDALDVVIHLHDCAQICLPNDRDDGITIVSECHASARVTGVLKGERVVAACRSVLEFNRAAA